MNRRRSPHFFVGFVFTPAKAAQVLTDEFREAAAQSRIYVLHIDATQDNVNVQQIQRCHVLFHDIPLNLRHIWSDVLQHFSTLAFPRVVDHMEHVLRLREGGSDLAEVLGHSVDFQAPGGGGGARIRVEFGRQILLHADPFNNPLEQLALAGMETPLAVQTPNASFIANEFAHVQAAMQGSPICWVHEYRPAPGIMLEGFVLGRDTILEVRPTEQAHLQNQDNALQVQYLNANLPPAWFAEQLASYLRVRLQLNLLSFDLVPLPPLSQPASALQLSTASQRWSSQVHMNLSQDQHETQLGVSMFGRPVLSSSSLMGRPGLVGAETQRYFLTNIQYFPDYSSMNMEPWERLMVDFIANDQLHDL